jgi:hypothetical protein
MRRTHTVIAAIAIAAAAALAGTSAQALSGHDRSTIRPAHVAQQQDPDDDAAGIQERRAPKADKAILIAEEFDVDAAEVTALREQGIGWGALFKLYAIADARGVSVDALISGAPLDAEGERGFAFGEMMQSLTDEERAALEDHPKNFGQLNKGNKPKKELPADEP